MTTVQAALDAPVTTAMSADQIQQFNTQGFIAIPRLLDAQTLTSLQEYYDKIVRHEIELPGDRQLGGVTRQVMNPSKHIPYFLSNPAVKSGIHISSQILGTSNVELCFDMLIYKPPLHPKPTPWHQDFAYNGSPVAAEGSDTGRGGIQFWVALDDVDFENGCMHFIPQQHTQGLKRHFVYAGQPTDPGRLLATDAFGDPDLPNAGIACPLAAGGCTIHFYGTPHYTPPNITSNRGRRAYIFNIRERGGEV